MFCIGICGHKIGTHKMTQAECTEMSKAATLENPALNASLRREKTPKKSKIEKRLTYCLAVMIITLLLITYYRVNTSQWQKVRIERSNMIEFLQQDHYLMRS